MSSDKFKAVIEANASRPVPNVAGVSTAKSGVAKVVNLPAREEIDLQVEEHLIVELYSK